MKALIGTGEELIVCPQVLIEFWAVATRPRPVNGFGWSPDETGAHVAGIRRQFDFVDDGPGVFSVWLDLVTACGASGKRVHDLRLLAFAIARSLDRILTFNPADFPDQSRIIVVHPAAILRE